MTTSAHAARPIVMTAARSGQQAARRSRPTVTGRALTASTAKSWPPPTRTFTLRPPTCAGKGRRAHAPGPQLETSLRRPATPHRRCVHPAAQFASPRDTACCGQTSGDPTDGTHRVHPAIARSRRSSHRRKSCAARSQGTPGRPVVLGRRLPAASLTRSPGAAPIRSPNLQMVSSTPSPAPQMPPHGPSSTRPRPQPARYLVPVRPMREVLRAPQPAVDPRTPRSSRTSAPEGAKCPDARS
jgi:hypothetical protein